MGGGGRGEVDEGKKEGGRHQEGGEEDGRLGVEDKVRDREGQAGNIEP